MNQTKILKQATVLLVKDVQASTEYFVNQCGFRNPEFYGEKKHFCMLHREAAELMLQQAPVGHPITPHWKVVDQVWNIYFWVDDVESLYAEFQKSGAHIDYELCDQPWGCREFGIQDLDGHDIAFGQIID